ncbi:MAG: hypothetical protein IPO19_00145 [Rhodoferax sp.]|nr:hypothetical protein [Rhodoferax sp.]
MAGGIAYIEGRQSGPTSVFVDSMAGWAWDKPGGDWIDADGVRYGPNAWASVVAATIGGYSMDVTGLVNRSLKDRRWLAVLMRCAHAARQIAGQTGEKPPRIDVTFEDGTTTTLACWMAASVRGDSTIPAPGAVAPALPAVLEFDKPSQTVKRALLHFECLSEWPSYGGPPSIEVMLLDPPINRDPQTAGLSAAYPLDAGIETHPAVFGAHRYEDGTVYADFVSQIRVNTDDEVAFDPNLYGRGAEDRTKLPHKDIGKWIMAGPDWSLVPSTWREDGFEPFAPGLGAMRIHMKDSGIKDGGVGGYGGSLAGNAHLYLPAARFGLQRRLFVRSGLRITRGPGYLDGPSGRPHVYTTGTQSKRTDDAGKFFPMPSHARTTGGVSGCRGGFRWQSRLGWKYNDSMLGGPDEGGWMIYGHFFDFQTRNPPGHAYTNDTREKTNFGQRGGLGAMVYFDQWYDIEAEILLNSVDQPGVLADGSPHFKDGARQFWTADGAWRVWIDGRLAFERTGLVFRTLPAENPGFRAGYGRPCRELGHEGLWMNWFHGGVTLIKLGHAPLFLSGLVWSEQRIGPMAR